MFINIKSKVIFLLLVLFSVSISYSESLAVPVAPILHTMSQPDGMTIQARQWGDENISGWETEDGYSIVFDTAINGWAYAIHGADGNLVTSSMVVGIDSPPDVPKRIRPIGQVIYKKMLTRETRAMDNQLQYSPTDISEPQGVVPPTGTGNIPVILINFNNTTTITTPAQFDTLLFAYGNNSMRDYYNEVSYGAFTVSAGPAGVSGWYTAANAHNYYGYSTGFQRAAILAKEAVTQADSAINFASYDQDGDCFVDVADIVHQGTGTEASGNTTDIWSHRWSFAGAGIGAFTTNDACPAGGNIKVNDYVIQPEIYSGQIHTVGVFAHEYGHALGLPDLYDTDGSSQGIGNWSLMASGSWNGVTRQGDRPAHMDAWSKYFLNWITPTQVTGTLTSEPIEQAATSPDVYQLGTGIPLSGEYFLVENRQKIGFDAGLPGAGLLIWHIDGNMISTSGNTKECYPALPCNTTRHYGVRLVQADNLWDLERNIDRGDTGDPYPGSTSKTSFTSTSNPNNNLYNGFLSEASVTSISGPGTTMNATFSLLTFTVTPYAGSGGSINPSTVQTVNYGSTIAFTVTPNSSYSIASVTGCGGSLSGNTYTTGTITADCAVTATFAINVYSMSVIKNGTGSGTVTSAPVGIDCGADCTESYNYNTSVTLTAVPAPGSYFAGWSTSYGCSVTGATITCTLTASRSVSATFNLWPVLTVTKAGTGSGTVTSAPVGIDCGADCTESYDYNTSVTLTAVPATGSYFAGWSYSSGCSAGSTTDICPMTSSRSITATFTLNTYALTVSKAGTASGTVTSNPIGINCGTDCAEFYDYNKVITLTAVPAVGSYFAGWSGAGCTGRGSCTVTIDDAKTVTAAFTLVPIALTVSKTGTGSGTVTSSPVGIDCGTDCTESYDYNTSVTLTATPNTGSTFTGWSGGGCSGTGTCAVMMDASKTITATFTLNTYALTVSKAGAGSGTVTSSPVGINCGADCTEPYNYNTVVTLTAAAATGSSFAGWSGACTGTGACTVTMDAAKTVTATFNLMITVTLVPDSTSIPRGGTLGYTVTVTNNTSTSQTFQYWTYVILPNGSRYPTTGELFGPVAVALLPGAVGSAHLTHRIPATAPLGTYTYYGNVGPYPVVWDSDSFNFTVTSALAPQGETRKGWELLENGLTK